MLVIKNEVDFPHFKYLVNEFRRVQVSRFPIEVVVSNEGMVIGFVDSRFPTDRFNVSNMLAMLYVESNTNEKPTITIESRLINNEKFASHNDKFRTRSTHDLKKMFKYMKEYIKPFSGQEVAQKSLRTIDNEFDSWQSKADWALRETLNHVSKDEWMEGIMKLQALGIEPPTKKFAELVKTAIPQYEEHKRRQAMEKPNYHIAINPDDSVVVTIMRGDDKGSSIKESLDACPLFIQQNVGMLKMVNDNERIPEVGTKVNATQFWIEGKPQE